MHSCATMARTWAAAAATAMYAIALPVAADDFPLLSDEAETLAVGAIELEAQVEAARTRAPQGKARETEAQFQWAYGLARNLTAIIELPYIRASADATQETAAQRVRGVGDAEASLKWRFYKRGAVHAGLKGELLLPTGSEDKGLGTGKLGSGIAALLSIEEEGKYELHANAGVRMPRYKDADAAQAARRTLPRFSAGGLWDITDAWQASAGLLLERAAFKEEPGWQKTYMLGASYDLGQAARLRLRVLRTVAGDERGVSIGVAYQVQF
jgi:hypothetical protein